MDDKELMSIVEELKDIENRHYGKDDDMASISLLREDGINIEDFFDSMTKGAVKEIKALIREMKVFDAVLNELPEGTVKSQLESWLVDESGWYI